MAFIDPIEFISKKGKPIRIRCLEVSEALALREAIVEIAETSPYILLTPDDFRKKTKEDQEKFISSYNESEFNFLIIAESDKKIIGVFNFGRHSRGKSRHRGSLGISVHADFRGEGIAKKLFDVCIGKIKTYEGFEYLELDVIDINQPALDLYKRVGFIQTTHLLDAYRTENGNGVGNISMRLAL